MAFWNYGLAINQTRNGELNNDLGISLNLHDDSKKGCARNNEAHPFFHFLLNLSSVYYSTRLLITI